MPVTESAADTAPFSVDGNDIILRLHVQPGAKRTGIVGRHGDALKIRLAAPPVDGRANVELIRFLARTLGVGRTAITLLAGETSRAKRVRIAGLTAAQALHCLQVD